MRFRFFVSLSLLTASAAFAAKAPPVAPYPLGCQGLSEINRTAKRCGDNELYVSAGVHCVQTLEKMVESKSASLKKDLEKLRTANHQQKEKLREAQKSYEAQERELQRLIATAKGASRNIQGYLDNIVFPDHWDHEGEIKDYEKFFESEKCFAEPRETLFETLEDVDIILSDLEDTLKLARSMKAQSSGREADLDSAGVKNPTGGKEAAPAPVKKAKPKGNTITGIKKDQEKRSKAKPQK